VLRFIAGILFFTSILTASNSVAFGHKKRVYTIQLFSIKRTLSKQAIFHTVPRALRNKLHLHKVKNATVACYSQAADYKSIRKALSKVRKAGYKQAYIITTTRWYMPQKEKVEDTKNRTPKLSKYVVSQMIVKANKAYKNADESRAMMYYEMLLSSGVKSSNIKNNLCYLYGKQGAWEEAKNIIDNERYPTRLIYAYANGAVRTSQKSFYDDLQNYILLDRSGHLDLLAGYYFEENNNLKRAVEFYKKAYEKNRNDIYNAYAYARFLDILKKKKEAFELYENLYERTREDNAVHKAVKIRLHQQGSFL